MIITVIGFTISGVSAISLLVVDTRWGIVKTLRYRFGKAKRFNLNTKMSEKERSRTYQTKFLLEKRLKTNPTAVVLSEGDIQSKDIEQHQNQPKTPNTQPDVSMDEVTELVMDLGQEIDDVTELIIQEDNSANQTEVSNSASFVSSEVTEFVLPASEDEVTELVLPDTSETNSSESLSQVTSSENDEVTEFVLDESDEVTELVLPNSEEQQQEEEMTEILLPESKDTEDDKEMFKDNFLNPDQGLDFSSIEDEAVYEKTEMIVNEETTEGMPSEAEFEKMQLNQPRILKLRTIYDNSSSHLK
jgi:hypothetical protein